MELDLPQLTVALTRQDQHSIPVRDKVLLQVAAHNSINKYCSKLRPFKKISEEVNIQIRQHLVPNQEIRMVPTLTQHPQVSAQGDSILQQIPPQSLLLMLIVPKN